MVDCTFWWKSCVDLVAVCIHNICVLSGYWYQICWYLINQDSSFLSPALSKETSGLLCPVSIFAKPHYIIGTLLQISKLPQMTYLSFSNSLVSCLDYQNALEKKLNDIIIPHTILQYMRRIYKDWINSAIMHATIFNTKFHNFFKMYMMHVMYVHVFPRW